MEIKIILTFIFLLNSLHFFSPPLLAGEKCGRSALINYQEVMVDTTNKGEGLRFYLEKDEKSLGLLNEYQSNIKPKWHNAVIGSFGTGLILFGMGKNGRIIGENDTGVDSKKVKEKRILIISGFAILIVNYLIIKTLEQSNEKLLLRSIDEYNKRNVPKIFVAPEGQSNLNLPQKFSYRFGMNFMKEF